MFNCFQTVWDRSRVAKSDLFLSLDSARMRGPSLLVTELCFERGKSELLFEPLDPNLEFEEVPYD